MGGRGSSSNSAAGGSSEDVLTRSRGGYTITYDEYDKYAAGLRQGVYNKTGISRKQAGVLYSAYKRGELNATKEQINTLYNHTFNGGYGYSTKTSEVAADVSLAISAISAGDSNAANYFFQQFLWADEHGR